MYGLTKTHRLQALADSNSRLFVERATLMDQQGKTTSGMKITLWAEKDVTMAQHQVLTFRILVRMMIEVSREIGGDTPKHYETAFWENLYGLDSMIPGALSLSKLSRKGSLGSMSTPRQGHSQPRCFVSRMPSNRCGDSQGRSSSLTDTRTTMTSSALSRRSSKTGPGSSLGERYNDAGRRYVRNSSATIPILQNRH